MVGVLAGDNGHALTEAAADVTSAYGRKLAPLISSLGVTGEAGEVVRVPSQGIVNAGLVVFVGLGAEESVEAVRRAAGVASRAVPNCTSVALALSADTPEHIGAIVSGWQLGSYSFTKFKSKPAASRAPADVIVLSPIARRAEAVAAFESAQIVARAVALARDWVNEPPGTLTPPLFAEAVEAAHATWTKGRGKPTVKLTVQDENDLAELGFGGTLAVGNSSDAPPRLVSLEYSPAKPVAHLALVGKGVTYDSGGLTIKPSASMVGMKGDMAGAAAVVAATYAIAQLGLPVRVTTYAPMAENMVSGRAMRPGDVITMYGGLTVEIANTDAEGRLLLGDALALASEQKPDIVLDVATLTGHMQVALGDRIAAVMGSDDVVADVLAAAERAGEGAWPMPIGDDMVSRIHASKIADLLQHDWVRWGGGLMAGAFLREFTAGLPWAHIDMAGNELSSGTAGHEPAGASGYGVATVVEFARGLAASPAD